MAQTVYCVRPGATGSGNGSDWNNALPSLPQNLARGAIYYIAGGNYGKYTFNSPVSGSTYCTVKKATASAHGPDTGWQSAYAGQAVFTLVSINQNYFVFDGVTGGGPGSWTSGFGIKVDTSGQTSNTAYPAVFLGEVRQSATSYVTVSHLEIVGNGGDGVANNGGQTNDGVASWGGSNVTVSYSYIHDMGRCICIFLTTTNLVFEYNYTGKYEYDYGEHSEIASLNGNTQTFRNNIFSHVEGTGGLMFNGSGFDIYGNVFFHSINDKSWGYAANGIIGSKDSSEPVRNVRIYNNTFYRPFADNAGGGPQIFGFYMGTDSVAYNNLFYGTMPSSPGFNYVTHDYNHFVDITGASIPSETNRSTATGNPFVNAEGLNFTLTANTPAGKTLGSPYNIDPLGRTRTTWTRNAYEYSSGGTPTPTATATATRTPTPSPTPTSTPTATRTPTPSPTPTTTATPTPTATQSPTASPTPKASPTSSPGGSPQPPKGLQVLPTT